MKPENKIFVKAALLSGAIYAIINTVFNYADGERFNILKALIYFVGFGLFMGFLRRRNYLKKLKKDSQFINKY